MFPLNSQKIIGLDISDSSIELMALEISIAGPRLYSYNRMMFPYGVVRDGSIIRPEFLSEAIRHLMHTAAPHPLRRALCILSIPDSQVFSTVLHLPASFEGAMLRRAVMYELETSYPISLGEHYFDFAILEKDSHFQDVLVIATTKHLIQNYIELLQASSLLPLAFDVESLSIARALLGPSDKHKRIMIVDIGARTTNIGIFENNNLVRMYASPYGGNNITKHIARALGISDNEAEKIKRQSNMYSHNCDKRVRDAIEIELRNITLELKKIIQSYLYHKSHDVDSIILAGGTALLSGIHKYFQSQLRQNIEIRNPLKALNISERDKKNKRFIFFGNVLGLALRGMSRDPMHTSINLLHKARIRQAL